MKGELNEEDDLSVRMLCCSTRTYPGVLRAYNYHRRSIRLDHDDIAWNHYVCGS